MYIIIPSRKLKAGQIVIDLGFGHVDRCFSNYECRTFLFGIYTYSYHVTIYRKLLISNPSMTETRAERIIKSCSDVLNSMGNNARIVCFCKKLGVSFPCQTCAPLAKCCLIPFCNNLTINTFPILCTDHLRCDKCKNRYVYSANYVDQQGYLLKCCNSCRTFVCPYESWDILVINLIHQILNPNYINVA